MVEIWKEIEGYEGIYSISSTGIIKSLERYVQRKDGETYHIEEKIKTPTIGKRGYYVINLYKNNKRVQYYLHQLLGKAFIPNPDNNIYIDHKDGCKTNNTVWFNEDGTLNYEKTNLRWCTHKENLNNPHTVEKIRQAKIGIKQSEESIQKRVSKLRGRKKKPYKQPKLWKPVLQYTLDGVFIREWDSITEPAKIFNAHHISECCRGTCKSSGGHKWAYK